jgi:hypothetical protein
MQLLEGLGAYCVVDPGFTTSAVQLGQPDPLKLNLSVVVLEKVWTPLKRTPHEVDAGKPTSVKVTDDFTALKLAVTVPGAVAFRVVEGLVVLPRTIDPLLDFQLEKTCPKFGVAVITNGVPELYHPLPGLTDPVPPGLIAKVRETCLV